MKFIFSFLIALLLCFTLLVPCCAQEEEYYDEQLEASGAAELEDELPEEARGLLEELGIDGVDFASVFSASPRKLIKLFIDLLKGSLSAPLKCLSTLAGVLALMAAFQSFYGSQSKLSSAASLCCSCFMVLSAAIPLSSLLGAAVSAIETGSGFMLALIPVLAGIITAAGNPLTAVSFNSFAFIAAQGLSGFCSNFMAPCAGITAALGIAAPLLPEFGISEICGFVKKAAVWSFATFATLFTAFISLKSILAGSADTVTAKGVKLAVNSFIPVVGSALGEAYACVVGSAVLIRNTVGAFAIAALAAINAPIILQLLLWKISLSLAAFAAELLGIKSAAELLKAFSGAVTLVNVCVIFNAVLLIITAGIVLTFKSGV